MMDSGLVLLLYIELKKELTYTLSSKGGIL